MAFKGTYIEEKREWCFDNKLGLDEKKLIILTHKGDSDLSTSSDCETAENIYQQVFSLKILKRNLLGKTIEIQLFFSCVSHKK